MQRLPDQSSAKAVWQLSTVKDITPIVGAQQEKAFLHLRPFHADPMSVGGMKPRILYS